MFVLANIKSRLIANFGRMIITIRTIPVYGGAKKWVGGTNRPYPVLIHR